MFFYQNAVITCEERFFSASCHKIIMHIKEINSWADRLYAVISFSLKIAVISYVDDKTTDIQEVPARPYLRSREKMVLM